MTATRGRGRPTTGERVELRLTPDVRADVGAWADAENVTVAEAYRRLISAGLDARRPELANAIEELRQWAADEIETPAEYVGGLEHAFRLGRGRALVEYLVVLVDTEEGRR